MELKLRNKEDIYIIDILGEMSPYNSFKLKELLMKMVEKKIEKIIISMKDVKSIDSSGIGALIFITSTTKKMNVKLSITNVNEAVQKIIETTKLSNFFPIFPNLKEAINYLEDN